MAVDMEMGGFNEQTDALLEIAAVILDFDEKGRLHPTKGVTTHVTPFDGSNMDPKSLEVNGIDPYNPLRAAREERDALTYIFEPIRKAVSDSGCTRAILVGHNAWNDLKFLNAAVKRTGIKKNPFHAFSSFDTVSFCGLAYGQTVLARAAVASGMEFDTGKAHGAAYDAKVTAELFCRVVNRWEALHEDIDAPIADGSILPR